jgi:hypothetical protein
MKNPVYLYLLAAVRPIAFIGIWVTWNMARDSRDEKLLERSVAWPETQGRVTGSRISCGRLRRERRVRKYRAQMNH